MRKNKRIKYTDEPIEAKIIKDFLPSPDQLILKEDNVKVTLTLSRKRACHFSSSVHAATIPPTRR